MRILAAWCLGGLSRLCTPDIEYPHSRLEFIDMDEASQNYIQSYRLTDIPDLRRIADTSQRTLEYFFRDYFGTFPKWFTKALDRN